LAWSACSTYENAPRGHNHSAIPVSSERTALRKVSLAEKNEQQQKFGYRRDHHGCRLPRLYNRFFATRETTSLPPESRPSPPFGDSEFDDGFGWNLDLLLRLRIKARPRFPLLLYELAKTGQDKFAVLFNRFVREVAECIDEYSSDSFVSFGGNCERDLKFTFGHVWALFMAADL
jgi:hypothetical protein